MAEQKILTRKLKPLDTPEARALPLKRETIVFKKGSQQEEGAMPLPCDMIKEKDVPLTMRDGTVLYADVFLPVTEEKIPAIISWAPYGKGGTGAWTLDEFPGRLGISKSRLSGLQAWEGCDPGYWCDKGYAIVQVDARGAFHSEGQLAYFSSQEGRDGYDTVEQIANMDWCSGKIGFAGNSWLALSQWRIAEQCPPHLAAIAPWEGLTDPYRDIFARGGIPDLGFPELVLQRLYGNGEAEDPMAMMQEHPLIDWYWEDKAVDTSKIEVPVYAVASYTNAVHVEGTFRGWRNLKSSNWLRIHNTVEWPDFYTEEYVEDLRKFFDRYLKERENGWEDTPHVRMSVLDPGHEDIVGRPENSFPANGAAQRNLYLDMQNGTLTETVPPTETTTEYEINSDKACADFRYEFREDTEISGYPVLKLWVSLDGYVDGDLFVQMQKLDADGNQLFHHALGIPPFGGSEGLVRLSRRSLKATASQEPPEYAFTQEEMLREGEIVPVTIPLSPIAMRWHKGEVLRLRISANPLRGATLPGVPAPKKLPGKRHILHGGGKYDACLQFSGMVF